MTVTTLKIDAEIGEQTADHAKGIVDVSEKQVRKVAHTLRQKEVSEKHAMMLATTFFKMPDKINALKNATRLLSANNSSSFTN